MSEIDVAPAHDDDVISAHKGEDGGLPTIIWLVEREINFIFNMKYANKVYVFRAILGVILIAFHVFLIKLLYSEWQKGDSTPYNSFLRKFRDH